MFPFSAHLAGGIPVARFVDYGERFEEFCGLWLKRSCPSSRASGCGIQGWATSFHDDLRVGVAALGRSLCRIHVNATSANQNPLGSIRAQNEFVSADLMPALNVTSDACEMRRDVRPGSRRRFWSCFWFLIRDGPLAARDLMQGVKRLEASNQVVIRFGSDRPRASLLCGFLWTVGLFGGLSRLRKSSSWAHLAAGSSESEARLVDAMDIGTATHCWSFGYKDVGALSQAFEGLTEELGYCQQDLATSSKVEESSPQTSVPQR